MSMRSMILLMAVSAESLTSGMGIGMAVIAEDAIVGMPDSPFATELSPRLMNSRVGTAETVEVIMAANPTAGLVASGMASGARLKVIARLGSMIGLPGQRGMTLRHPALSQMAINAEIGKIVARPAFALVGFGVERMGELIVKIVDLRCGIITPVAYQTKIIPAMTLAAICLIG